MVSELRNRARASVSGSNMKFSAWVNDDQNCGRAVRRANMDAATSAPPSCGKTDRANRKTDIVVREYQTDMKARMASGDRPHHLYTAM